MFTQKVLINFRSYKDDALDQKAGLILLNMTGNTNFPTPIPALTSVQTALDAYTAALAALGTPTATVAKNQARASLESLLASLAGYVQRTSNADVGIMLSSGFDVSKPPTPVGVLPKPLGFTVKNATIKGSIVLSVKPVPGAKSYQFEYTDAPVTATSVWKILTGTATTFTVPGLQSTKEYTFRVAGIGSNPARVYTDEISLVCL